MTIIMFFSIDRKYYYTKILNLEFPYPRVLNSGLFPELNIKLIKMNNRNLLICLVFVLASINGTAQTGNNNKTSPVITDILSKETRDIYSRKGKIFLFWGYNRSAYSHSNIHFKGDGYNFSITDIRANDDPSKLSKVYVGPTTFTIPQYNYRIGYFLSDKMFVSVGSDHMKYNMAKQTTHLTGSVTKGINTGTYNNTEAVVGENSEVNNPGASVIDNLPGGFVTNFEHCDGLNDFSCEIGRLDQLWISNNHKHAFAVVGTAGLGMVIPDTDADILGQEPKHDMEANKKAYHLAGYSISATMGLQLDLFKHAFVLARLKAGYINLPDINTTAEGGKASQHFDFIEPMLVFGYTFHFKK